MREKEQRAFRIKILFLLVLLVAAIVAAILLGSVSVSIGESMRIIGSRLPIINRWVSADGISASHQTIIMDLRLPRTMMALLAGMGLAVAGCVYQGVFSNPMADPYLLGVSSGAALGATAAILLPISGVIFAVSSISVLAFAGAILVLLFVFNLAKRKGKLDTISLILSGIAINYFISSFIALLMLFNRQKLENVYFWTLGSFKDSNWGKILLVGIVLVLVTAVIFRYNRELNMIMISEDQAKTLGVSTERVKKILIVVSSFLVAIIVSNCGIIGFVGLITPHAGRMLIGPNHKRLIPFSMVLGGLFMVVSDTLARSLIPNLEISVGIITALFGVPFFLSLLQKNKRQRI